MSDSLQHIIPTPQPAEDIFAVYQTTRDFHDEVQTREAFDRYCQWYERIAAQNRQELQQMQQEVNIIRWFYGRGG